MAGKNQSTARKIWQTLSSIKTGVILLILVVIISAAGTVILQRPVTEPDEMQRAYSPQMLRLLDAMGLTNVFHSWWFITLMGLVSLSIIAASIQRFPNSWRFYARPYKSTGETFRKALPQQVQIPIPGEEAGLAAAERALRRMRITPERIVGEKSFSLFAERNRISEMAVYIVHASLLLIFMGGIVDGLFGWNGFLMLNRGEQSNQVALHDTSIRHMPFAVRCDNAGQENYADGSPKKWWSQLAVLQDGREVLRKEIVVNDPLVYQGVRFYQSSYGPNGRVEKLILAATPAGTTNIPKDVAIGPDETVALDENTTLRMAEFIPDYVVRDGQVYTRSAEVENPAVHLLVESKSSGKAVNVWLPPIPGFEENARSPYQFEAKDLQMGHFTGLQVSHEPGQWTVWAGVILMGFGLAVVFYLVHMRFWIVPVRNAQGQLMLWVGGAANKNKDVFEERFRKLVKEIESEVKPLGAGVPTDAASLVTN
jgi:cytochrome c biogenesis protein